MKKRKIILIIASVLLILAAFSFLTTYSGSDNGQELASYLKKYAGHGDLNGAAVVNRFEHNNERFTLYKHQATYFIVWSTKSLLIPGRYKIEGGSLPGASKNQDLGEFQKFDSSGLVYILYGPYRSGQIELNIQTDSQAVQSKKYEVSGKDTFVVYTAANNVDRIEYTLKQ